MRNNTELQQLRQALPIVREKLPPDVFHAVLDDFGAQYASRLREAVRRRHPLTPHEAHPASHCPAGGGFSRASRKAAARSPTPGQTDKPDPPPHTASEAQPENSRTHGTCCTQGGERTGGAALSTVAVRSDPRQEAACRFTGHWVAEREISAYERIRWAPTSSSPTGQQTMTARWVLLFQAHWCGRDRLLARSGKPRSGLAIGRSKLFLAMRDSPQSRRCLAQTMWSEPQTVDDRRRPTENLCGGQQCGSRVSRPWP